MKMEAGEEEMKMKMKRKSVIVDDDNDDDDFYVHGTLHLILCQ